MREEVIKQCQKSNWMVKVDGKYFAFEDLDHASVFANTFKHHLIADEEPKVEIKPFDALEVGV